MRDDDMLMLSILIGAIFAVGAFSSILFVGDYFINRARVKKEAEEKSAISVQPVSDCKCDQLQAIQEKDII